MTMAVATPRALKLLAVLRQHGKVRVNTDDRASVIDELRASGATDADLARVIWEDLDGNEIAAAPPATRNVGRLVVNPPPPSREYDPERVSAADAKRARKAARRLEQERRRKRKRKRFSFSAVEVVINGQRFEGVTSIDYSQDGSR